MTEFSHAQESVRTDWLSRPITMAINLDWEKAIYLGFVVLSLITRMWGLGDRVVSHDESLHTQYSYQYFNGDGYRHTPLMHGPSLFHITALSFWLLGDNDFTARVPVAIVGALLVILPYFLRNWIGRVGSLFASFLLLISPYITYYSRYIRHDIYAIFFAAVVFIAIHHYLRQRQDKYLWWFAAGLSLLFTTMETSYIYVAIFGSFLALRLVVKIMTASWIRNLVPQMRTALILLGLSLLVIGTGFVGQRLATSVMKEATPEAEVSTSEGFAVDPSEAGAAAEPEGAESGAESAMRWLQIGGLGLLSLALFLTAYRLRPHIDAFPEFDLVILFATLILPTTTAFLVVMAGGDPRNSSTPGLCQVAGQETMSPIGLFFTRIGLPECRSAFLSSDIVLSGVFLMITLSVSVVVGLWWHRRRWLIAAAIFHVIFLVLFTSFFTNPAGWASGMVGSLGYWLAQHDVRRADQPSYFYLLVLPLYEFLPVLLTLAGGYLWARKHRLSKIIIYWIPVLLAIRLAYGFANWLANRTTTNLDETTVLPGIVASSVILLAAGLYWFAARRRQIMAEYNLGRSWRGLISLDELLGFVPYLLWWFFLSLFAYSVAGEKMAWLSTHFVLPMVLVGGWFVNELVREHRLEQFLSRRFALQVGLVTVLLVAIALALGPLFLGKISLGNQQAASLSGLGRFLGSLAVVGILYYFVRQGAAKLEPALARRAWIGGSIVLLSLLTIRFNYMASFRNADYTTEFLVYAHGAPATKSQVLSQLEELSMRLHGDKSIKVAYDNDSSWPFTWYLRDYPNRLYFGENPGRNITDAPVVITGSLNWSKVEPLLNDDYESRDYTFLWWPMEEYRKLSWNAILGDPNAPPESRRGLGNPQVRQALWDIIFYRDYQKYGEVFGGTFTAGQWPLRHDLRMYIRKDVLATLWDHGIDAVAYEPPVDPYAENEYQLSPSLVVGSTGSGNGELMQPRNISVASDGMIFVADSGNHRIQAFDQQGSFVNSWGGFGSTAGLLNEPWGLDVDGEFVYVADTWNHRIQKFTRAGDLIGVFGQSGSPTDGQEGGGLFFGPRDIVILSDGNLLVTDTGNHRLQILTPDGDFVQALGSQGSQMGQFYEPVGVDLNPDAALYLADTWNGRIQQFNSDLLAVNEWGIDAWSGESINNKPYLAVDKEGNVYVTDPEGYRVLIFDGTGQYIGRFGHYGSDRESFGLPNGIDIDAQDNIYIADAGNNRVLKFSPFLEAVGRLDVEEVGEADVVGAEAVEP